MADLKTRVRIRADGCCGVETSSLLPYEVLDVFMLSISLKGPLSFTGLFFLTNMCLFVGVDSCLEAIDLGLEKIFSVVSVHVFQNDLFHLEFALVLLQISIRVIPSVLWLIQ
jgi:hypothetical protein